MKTLAEIGETLATECERAGYTQEGLAEKMGVSVISISRWENGSNMKMDMIQQMVTALGISADYLLGTQRRDDSLSEMMIDLSLRDQQVIYSAVTAMITEMKKTKQK